MPIAFLTAEYALRHLGRMRRGERVLIHAAAGGVGLAAIQIAQRAGAEIYATAGSEEKREYLRSLGVEHIFDSRSVSFARDVMMATNGEGVDLALNSLAGALLRAGLTVLREGGRFLEIGKHDIYQNTQVGLLPFRNSLSFSAVNLDAVLRREPELMGEMLCALASEAERNLYRPLPMRVFSIAEGPRAFRHMAQAKHIGKIILRLPETGREPERPLLPVRRAHGQIRADATYLITGGLGALGLGAAEWLVEQGARHLALIGRTDPSENALAAIEGLRRSGAAVVTARADVSRREELARVLTQIEGAMPPLRGIIHAAGLLSDGAVQRMTREQLYQVMAPKVAGAWNLHELTLSHDLDFFALYSSAASFIGSPGQAGYAAGNAFLDGLAHYRRARGLKALSINWGPWSEAGMAARPDRGGRLAVRGVESLSPRQSLAAFELLLKQDGGQFAVMSFDCEKWRRFYPATSKTSLFVRLAQDQEQSQRVKKESSDNLSASEILGAAPSERAGLLQNYLSQIIARVLGHSEFSRLSPDQPLNRLGIDSLMAIEIKSAIESNLGAPVPIADLLGGKSLAQLTAHVLERAPQSSIGSTTVFAACGDEPAEAEIGAGQAGDEPFVIELMQEGLAQERLAWAVAAGDEENEQEWEVVEL